MQGWSRGAGIVVGAGAFDAVCVAAGRTFELLDDHGEFLLHYFDGLLDDGVGFQAADGFDFDVEFGGGGVVVEWGGGGGGFFPVGVFGFGPST